MAQSGISIDALRDLWQRTAPTQRGEALHRLVQSRSAPGAAAWYLLGWARLAEGSVGLAARCFGMAYHADCRLASSALLTFVCLKSAAGSGGNSGHSMPDIEPLLRSTWDEMKRPSIGESSLERSVWEIVAGGRAAPQNITALDRLVWLLRGASSDE